MKKIIIYSALACIAFTSCKEQKQADGNLEKFQKNLEVAKQFIAVFSTKDSTKEATLLADNFKWNGPAIGQDSLPKEALLSNDKELMNGFNDITLTNAQYLPGVDPVTYKIDGNVRVYGTWVTKSASSGKTVKLRYYAVFEFNEAGKITALEEYTNMEDLKKEY
jgi:ketosteroid isomerase-like protein